MTTVSWQPSSPHTLAYCVLVCIDFVAHQIHIVDQRKKRFYWTMRNGYMDLSFLLVILSLLGLYCQQCQGFAFLPSQQLGLKNFVSSADKSISTTTATTTTEIGMGKKRRKRKDNNGPAAGTTPSTPPPSPVDDGADDDEAPSVDFAVSDELPEFELDDEPPKPEPMPATPPPAAMTGSGELKLSKSGMSRSIQSVVADRSFLNNIEDEVRDDSENIDELDELARLALSGKLGPPAKSFPRPDEFERNSPQKSVSADSEEDGEFNALKLLENGAWVGIFLLVAWEIYLNSPFFERAAPLAPVVYNLLN